MATKTEVEENIREFFDATATRDHWDDYVKIGVFLSQGYKSIMANALQTLENAIRSKILGSESFNPSEQGQDVLRACFRELEGTDGFVTPARAPAYVGFVTHTPFMDALKQRMHWEDIGAGPSHGRYTHRVQWYAIKKAGILGEKASGDVFAALGEDNKFSVPRGNLPAQYSRELGETLTGTALWDIICDRIMGKTNCEPESDEDFRSPEKMNTWIQQNGKDSGMPLLGTILAELAALHPARGKTNLADIYARQVYGKSADQMGEEFIDAFDNYMAKARAGTENAKMEFTASEVGKPLFKWKEPSNKSCFLTTAIVRSLQLPDDCPQLLLLREFRDQILLNSRDGRDEVENYYAIAPRIVASIERRPDAGCVYRELYEHDLKPILRALRALDPVSAHVQYRRMVVRLDRRYL